MKRRRKLKIMFYIIMVFIVSVLFLSALSAFIEVSPSFSILFVPLRMLLQITMKFQIPILAIIVICNLILFFRRIAKGGEIPKAAVGVVLILCCVIIMETFNWIEIENARANTSNFKYSCMMPGKERDDYHLVLKQSYAKELDMVQCEVYQDSTSNYKNVGLIYLNYGGWAVQSEKYGEQIKNFCQDEGYTFIRFAVERNEDEGILELTQKINNRINRLLEKEKFDKVLLCGGSAGGHLAMLCAGKNSGDMNFPIEEIYVDGVIALYPCTDPGYAYDYYVNSDSELLAKQTKDLDEAVFGIRGNENSLYDVTAIQNSMDKTIPILIIHGKKDSMMPVKGSEDLYQNLSGRGYPISLLELPGTEHVFDMSSSVAWNRCEKEMTGFCRAIES